MRNSPRKERLHFRLTADDKTLFRTAAELEGQDMSEFVLSHARRAAEEAIAEQRNFVLPRAQYEAFLEALDHAPTAKPRLRRLLEESGVLEGDGENPGALTG